MYEGVEAGEDEQRHHGAQRHHVVELGLQEAPLVAVSHRLIGRRFLQPAGEVLQRGRGRGRGDRVKFGRLSRIIILVRCLERPCRKQRANFRWFFLLQRAVKAIQGGATAVAPSTGCSR